MNTKIFQLFIKNLKNSFNLPKYSDIEIVSTTVFDHLPWTPIKRKKFEKIIEDELQFDSIDFSGTLEDIVFKLDKRYTGRFFSNTWKPSTESHKFSGWEIVNAINEKNPKKILDYGCGYNQFKDKISGLIGIDPYNDAADYMVDIFEFVDDEESFDAILVLGSLNFNSQDELEIRMKKIVTFLKPGGYMYFRANPGIQWPKGPYVDIFPWSFDFVVKLAKDNNLSVELFKKDTGTNGERYYFVYKKLFDNCD
jgi:SAM-dependent methyltransferase